MENKVSLLTRLLDLKNELYEKDDKFKTKVLNFIDDFIEHIEKSKDYNDYWDHIVTTILEMKD